MRWRTRSRPRGSPCGVSRETSSDFLRCELNACSDERMSTYSIPPSVPPSVEALLRLFHEQLAEVRFPGMDAQVLAAAVARVADAESEVARLSLALDAAHAALRDAV